MICIVRKSRFSRIPARSGQSRTSCRQDELSPTIAMRRYPRNGTPERRIHFEDTGTVLVSCKSATVTLSEDSHLQFAGVHAARGRRGRSQKAADPLGSERVPPRPFVLLRNPVFSIRRARQRAAIQHGPTVTTSYGGRVSSKARRSTRGTRYNVSDTSDLREALRKTYAYRDERAKKVVAIG